MAYSVYLETTVISYLTARQSRDLVVAAHQEITREWWRDAAEEYHLVASGLVVSEANSGDPHAARDRLKALENVELLRATAQAEDLADSLVSAAAVPPRASEDAAHIAIAAVNGVDFLVTWNFRHIANATMRARIEQVCRESGFEPPVICTPNELLEAGHEKT